MNRPCRFVLIVVALSVLFSGCALFTKGLKSPNISLANLEVTSASLFESVLRIELRVQNPNNIAFETRGIEFDLEINGNRVATGLSSAKVAIPAFGSSTIPIEVYASMFQLLKGAVKIHDDGFAEYKIAGRLHLKPRRWIPGSLPFKSTGKIRIEGLPRQ